MCKPIVMIVLLSFLRLVIFCCCFFSHARSFLSRDTHDYFGKEMSDKFSFLRNVHDPRTKRFLKKKNNEDKKFHGKLGLQDVIVKEIKSRLEETELEAPFNDRDGILYQFVFEKDQEMETLYRNGKAVLDLNKLDRFKNDKVTYVCFNLVFYVILGWIIERGKY
jgi:protease II